MSPKIQINNTATREEAAAITAAIERFLSTKSKPGQKPSSSSASWQKAGLIEGVNREMWSELTTIFQSE